MKDGIRIIIGWLRFDISSFLCLSAGETPCVSPRREKKHRYGISVDTKEVQWRKSKIPRLRRKRSADESLLGVIVHGLLLAVHKLEDQF